MPGSGKSRLAAEVVMLRARARVVDIDDLRVRFDDWQTQRATMAAARERACDLIAEHLAAGDDVIVPQFVSRPEFVARLRSIAATHRASWIEVVVDVETVIAVGRFRSRRAMLRLRGEGHPESEIPDDEIATVIERAGVALAQRAKREPITPVNGSDVQCSGRQIIDILNFYDRRSLESPFAVTDGVVTIRSPIAADRAALLALRDHDFKRWLGPGSDSPAPTACVEREGSVVGWVDFDDEPRPHLTDSQINIGYALAPEVRGMGYVTRALQLLVHRLALVGESRQATLLIDTANHDSLAVATRAGFLADAEIEGNRMFVRTIPPLVYCDGVVTIRPRRADDLTNDLEAKDAEQQRWLWLPEHREQWSRMTDIERQQHAMTTLMANVEDFGRGPKWTFSVDAALQHNVGYIDVDLANDHAPYGEANISYATHPTHRGRGYARRAVSLITRFLIDHTAARSAYLSVAVDNVASRRVVYETGAVVVDSWIDADGRTLQRHRLPIVG